MTSKEDRQKRWQMYQERRRMLERLREKKETLYLAQELFGEMPCFSSVDYLVDIGDYPLLREIYSKELAKDSREVLLDIKNVPGAEGKIWSAVVPYLVGKIWLIFCFSNGFRSLPFEVSELEAKEYILRFYTTGLPGEFVLLSGESAIVFGDDVDTYDAVRYYDKTGSLMAEVRRLADLPKCK